MLNNDFCLNKMLKTASKDDRPPASFHEFPLRLPLVEPIPKTRCISASKIAASLVQEYPITLHDEWCDLDTLFLRFRRFFLRFRCDFVVVSRAILMHSSAWQMCPIFEGPSILGQKAKKCQGAFKCAICPISKTLFIFCTNGFEFRNIFSTLL